MAFKTLRDKSTRLTLATGLLIAASGQTLLAQESMEFGGREFVQRQARWFMQSAGVLYEVNPRVVTVKFKEDATADSRFSLQERFGFDQIRRNPLGYVDLQIPVGTDPLEYVQQMQMQDIVEVAEVNTIGEYLATPDDPRFVDQWHLPRINAPQAWDRATGSSSVIVAVLDSGTDVGHVDLAGNVWINPGEDIDGDRALDPGAADHLDTDDKNGVDDDGNGRVDDLVGWDFVNDDNDVRGPFFHGTHVAGIVAAMTNNTEGVAGVTGGFGADSGVLLMAIGVGDNAPDGSILDDAIIYAADMGADIITLSLSVGSSSAIDDAIDYAYNTRGVFINNAAGNNAGAVSYPATHVDVVAVSATDPSDALAGFSNRGPEIELAAPGVEIWSTRKNDNYGEGDGTSYASPQVAGVAGLLLSCNRSLSNADLRQLLTDNAVDLGDPGRDERFGFGLLDAQAALDATSCGVIPPPPPPPPPPLVDCGRHPWRCGLIDFIDRIAVLECWTRECIVFDPIPKNCLVKWNCPGCGPGGLCPPWYHIFVDEIRDIWDVTLLDVNGEVVKHEKIRTERGVILSFRPDEALYIDGQIGDYVLGFRMSKEGKPGQAYKIPSRVKTSNEPLGREALMRLFEGD